MAYRIDKEIMYGWIDNTIRGKVTGEIYLQGESEPICLNLEGDCHRDLAGCRCDFKNPSPILNKRLKLDSRQVGKIGDMTASRRCRIPEISPLEYYEHKKKGLNPKYHLANVLYLEWFSEKNGRVVIELPDIEIDVTLPKWKMTPEDEKKQQQNNMDNMTSFLDKLVEAGKPIRAPKVDEEMDEFEWELMLKDSDAKGAKYGELLEKYMDHPDCDKIIDEQMGWNMAEIFADTECYEDEGVFEEEYVESDDRLKRREHPLIKRIGNLWLSLYRHVEKTQYHNSQEPVSLLIGDLIFNIQFANAKAGSVLSDNDSYDNGMIIAILKRAITGIHKALNLAKNKEVIKALPEIIEPTQAELFVIREEMIKIMNKLRNEDF